MRDLTVVDPYVLAIPAGGGASIYVKFLDRVVAWGAALKRSDCCISERAISILATLPEYPSSHRIARILSDFGIESISRIDVQNALRVLSEREPFLEQITGIVDTCDNATVGPPEVYTRLPGGVASAWRTALVGVATYCHDEMCKAPSIGTADLSSREVSVEGLVSLIEMKSGEIDSVERTVCTTIPLASSPVDRLCSLPHPDPLTLITKLYQDSIQDFGGGPIRTIALGVDFVRSMDAHCLSRQTRGSLFRR